MRIYQEVIQHFLKKKTPHPKTCVENVLLIKFDSSQMLGVEIEYY